MGYTPLFSTLTSGTLCGRWPDIGLWPIVLSLADRHGVVDVTTDYIARVTGLALPEVVGCMQRFCEADPGSRSGAEHGARLMLLEVHRDWGWQIVNFGHYREKARLAAKAASEVESGRNRERMGQRGASQDTAADRRSPPDTAAQRPSDSYSDSDIRTKNASRRSADGSVDAVSTVFRHWQQIHDRHKAVLDDKRRKLISSRLKSYSAQQLCDAISGYINSPHHMGKNESKTVYTDIELLLRDAKHVEAGLQFFGKKSKPIDRLPNGDPIEWK